MRKISPGDSALATRLKREVRGDVLFDAASRGRYSTDASIYQIEPVGVVVPATEEDALQGRQHFLAQLLEFGAAVVHGRAVDRAQHAVWHVGRAGYLQEVAAALVFHGLAPGGVRYYRPTRNSP